MCSDDGTGSRALLCPCDTEPPRRIGKEYYMPIFEYHCEECGTTFERLTLRPHGAAQIACPQCGSTSTAKIFSTFSTTAGNGTSPGSSGSFNFS